MDEARLAANRQAAELFSQGKVADAAAAWEALARSLGPAEDDYAPGISENLGLAYLNLGRWDAAIRSFLRALDGQPTRREQSLRYLISSLRSRGRVQDAARYQQTYERAFGPYPSDPAPQ